MKITIDTDGPILIIKWKTWTKKFSKGLYSVATTLANSPNTSPFVINNETHPPQSSGVSVCPTET